MNDPQNSPPTAQTEGGGGALSDEHDDWSKLAREAYSSSTSYVDANYRKAWEDSIRAFNSQHANDSKYNQPAYDKRSRLYRPKTRSIIRKNEAAAAAAFFSNMDLTSVQSVDQTDQRKAAGAEVMKELLQYRLTKSIPWYQVVLGGIQDAQTVGVVCAHLYWDYQAKPKVEAAQVEVAPAAAGDEENPPQAALPVGAFTLGGGPVPQQPAPVEVRVDAVVHEKPLVDKPVIDLFPVENLRIDPGANWMNPIESSPYLIHLLPMYVMDVKAKMEKGEWLQMSDGQLRNSADVVADPTRTARNRDRQDPQGSDSKALFDYEICWVQRHIHRRDGEDWEFYCLKDGVLLTEPALLKESVLHGIRPFVMGTCILETHKVYPTGVPGLGKNLQEEANEIANQRIDNVKFVLNKKWIAKRGAEVDLGGLVRNVPGGIVMANDPEKDIREVTWPDVTASAYEEQSRIDNDMGELLGNFSPAQIMADHGINAPARNMAMLGQSAGTLVEYLLKTYVETFVQPCLRQLMKMEQAYETDQVIMAVAAKKAQLFQKYGIDQITDDLLDQELTLTVNVGMGATDPQMKLQKLLAGLNTFAALAKAPPPGMNLSAVGSEIFGYLGYSDGSRFFSQDPQNAALQQQLQQATQLIGQLNAKLADKQSVHQTKLTATEMTVKGKQTEEMIKQDGQNRRAAVVHLAAIRESDHQRAHEVASTAGQQMMPQIPMSEAR